MTSPSFVTAKATIGRMRIQACAVGCFLTE